MKKCNLISIFIFLASVLISCNQIQRDQGTQNDQNSTLEKIKKTGVMNVGYIVYPPTVIKDPNSGELSGHYIDAVEELAKQMNVKVEYQETDWGTFVAGLKSYKFDLSIAATYRTIPRAQEIAFTRPLMYVGNSVIIRKNDNRFRSIMDFNSEDITIAVTLGEQGHEFAKINLPKAKLKVLSVSDQSLTFTEVSVGRADAALGDSWACKQYAEKHPDVKDLFAENPYNLIPVGWAVRYDDPFWLQFINTAIDALESTGKLKEFEQKYDAHWLHPKTIWETW